MSSPVTDRDGGKIGGYRNRDREASAPAGERQRCGYRAVDRDPEGHCRAFDVRARQAGNGNGDRPDPGQRVIGGRVIGQRDSRHGG